MHNLFKLCQIVLLAICIVSCNGVQTLINRTAAEEKEEKLRKIEQIEAARQNAETRSREKADSINAQKPTAKERAAEKKSIQQKAFERAEAEAMAKSQARAAAEEKAKSRSIDKSRQTKGSELAREVASAAGNSAKKAEKTAEKTAKPETGQKVKQEARKETKQVTGTEPKAGYDVVLGTFSKASTAQELCSVARNYGYTAYVEKQGNMTAVVVKCPAGSRNGAEEFLQKILKEPFCPKDSRLRSR